MYGSQLATPARKSSIGVLSPRINQSSGAKCNGARVACFINFVVAKRTLKVLGVSVRTVYT